MSTVKTLHTLTVSKFIQAKRSRVFAAFSSLKEMSNWFGCSSSRIVNGEVDFREGGTYRLAMESDLYGSSEVAGTYHRIVPDERIEFSWQWQDEESLKGEGMMEVIVDFEDRNGGTNVVITHQGLPTAESTEGHRKGWSSGLDRIESLLAELAGERIPGVFCWNELLSPDAEGSLTFYGELFGWTSSAMDMPDGNRYHMLETMMPNSTWPVAGMFTLHDQMALKGASPSWMSYVSVENVDTAVAKAAKLGGKILKEVARIPKGRFAIIEDPQGARLGLWEPAADK